MTCTFWRNENEFNVELSLYGETVRSLMRTHAWPVSFHQDASQLTLWLDGRRYRLDYVFDADHLVLWHESQRLTV